MIEVGVEYIIYCRKSTDESSWKQAQSIPDQLRYCIEHAKKNGMKIKAKPEKFEFETNADIEKEDNDVEPANRKLYKETRHLYVIKEIKSAKMPWKREKWNKLMQYVKQGKIKGIISYSPDRQARNMLEGGELIDYVDQGLLALEYTNFHFDNSASGKMMLGIWFVFSKQYSDKLSEDSIRGSNTKHQDGKALWYKKFGYHVDEFGYHTPSTSFNALRRAFEMKLYEDCTDEQIVLYMKKNNVCKIAKDGTTTFPDSKKLKTQLWTDSFYYGAFRYGDEVKNLKDVNPHFEPVISEDEYRMLLRKIQKREDARIIKFDDEKAYVFPFEEKLLKAENGDPFTPTIANIKRFRTKLNELRIEKPDATLADVVMPQQIDYRLINTKWPQKNQNIKFSDAIPFILDLLKRLNLSQEMYQNYCTFAREQFEKSDDEIVEERHQIQFNLNKIDGDFKKFLKKNLWKDRDKAEEEVYQSEKKDFEILSASLKDDLAKNERKDKATVMEFEAFVGFLKNADVYYSKANYVQKRKIASILISNIKISPQWELQIEIKPWLEGMFDSIGDPTENRTPVYWMKTSCPDR